MPDLFGKRQLGRATTGGRFYATPTERVEAGAVYFPDESSLLFGVAEYAVEAGNLGAFATEGTFIFEKPSDWLDSLGRKVFFRPSTGEIVNQDRKGDVLIGFQIFANVPDDKLGVVLTSGENSVVIIVTSTADSGAGSLRQAIAAAQDGDVILFDADVFPAGQTTSILLSSQLVINKSISIYGGFSDGAGGYTSGATKRFYVYRDVEGVKTKVYIDVNNPAQEGETVLFENVCRVALDGQEAVRQVYLNSTAGAFTQICGICFKNGFSTASGASCYASNNAEALFKDCAFVDCVATNDAACFYITGSNKVTINDSAFIDCTSGRNGGGVYSASSSQNTLNGCIFDGCSATNGGAIYATSSAQNTLNGCVITNCSATSNGSAIYSSSSGEIILDNCELYNNIGPDATRKGTTFAAGSVGVVINTTLDAIRAFGNVTVTIGNGVTRTIASAFISSGTAAPVITIADGAALTLTGTATIGAATFTSAGRGYLAVAAGIDTSAATLTNVVLCAYGAGLESFDISADGASWTAEDLTTPILLEQKGDGDVWATLSDDATGGSYSDTFEIGTTLRAFDGVRFLVASLDAYWQVEPFVVASNGGGGAGDVSPSWTVSDATITPNVEEV